METILLAEDTREIREMVRRWLEGAGYTVLVAKSGAEALQITKKRKQPIRLLLTDVFMPGISGPELATQLTAHHKNFRVLYVSGNPEHPMVREDILKPGFSFLGKPFTSKKLLGKVREVYRKFRLGPRLDQIPVLVPRKSAWAYANYRWTRKKGV